MVLFSSFRTIKISFALPSLGLLNTCRIGHRIHWNCYAQAHPPPKTLVDVLACRRIVITPPAMERTVPLISQWGLEVEIFVADCVIGVK